MAKREPKKNIWVDSIFGTIFIYLFMFLIQNISTFRIFDALDPIGEALADMELTDYAFSELREPLPPDTNIVLINIGPLTRAGIAEELRIIDKYNPKVIGIDSFFEGYLGDTLGTLSLANAINDMKNDVVMVTKVEQSDSLAAKKRGEEVYDVLYKSDDMFTQNVELAIANLDTDARYQDDVKICRRFPPKRTLTDGTTHIAFGAKLADKIKPGITDELFRRGNEFETINFRGDFVNLYGEDKFSTRFYALDYDQVITENFVPELLKDKIVLVGYLGEDFLSEAWEDKFFTPLNEKIAGRANPDMYGLVIHANIASMILNGDYVDHFSDLTENFLGVVLCFLNVFLFSIIYHKMGAWYDGVTKLIQVVEVLLILFFIIYIFSWQSFKLELTVGLFAVALAGDLLEVYYGVIKNIFHRNSLGKVFKLGGKKKSSKKEIASEL